MLNDLMSSRSSLPAQCESRSSRKHVRICRGAASIARALLGAALLLGCGEDDPGFTYSRNVRPIFSQRCSVCHRPDGPSGIDIQNPFSNDGGLVTSKNRFKVLHPELSIPEDNVVPGDPDRSFLMYKIDPSIGLPPDPDEGPQGNGPLEPPAGVHMPLRIPELSYEQVHVIEAWVRAGATTEPFVDPGAPPQPAVPASADRKATPARPMLPMTTRSFAVDIQPIIGTEADLAATQADGGVCTPGPNKVCPRCIYCHYENGPIPPDLTDVFNSTTGLVNANARYRSDLKRVDPGNPDNSLLIKKLQYENFTTGFARSDYGAQMPYSFDELTANQIATVRQWIQEGAKP
jgi:mono/diheme cytochrome c family protein